MTRKITPAQLDEIEEAAKKIPPGPWELEGDEVILDRPATLDDMAYVATMDPATTLALVAEVREQRAKVERVREVHRRFSIYETCPEDGCENAHCFETAEGDYVHDDDLVGHVCHECSDLSDEEPIYWPCDTIKALGEEA